MEGFSEKLYRYDGLTMSEVHAKHRKNNIAEITWNRRHFVLSVR